MTWQFVVVANEDTFIAIRKLVDEFVLAVAKVWNVTEYLLVLHLNPTSVAS
jgi:hypothetical protein